MRSNRVDPRPIQRPQAGAGARPAAHPSFGDLLKAEQHKARVQQEGVTISAHASMRLREQGRVLSQQQVQAVSGAIEKAAGKGARESLMLMDDLALVVSVPNKTVITVVTKDRCKDNVFTNIDSAMIIDGLDLGEEAQAALDKSMPMALKGGQLK